MEAKRVQTYFQDIAGSSDSNKQGNGLKVQGTADA